MKLNFKRNFKTKVLMISILLGVAAIGAGCAVFYPWMGSSFYLSYEGGSRTTYFGSFASYSAYTDTSSSGCLTSTVTPYASGTAGTVSTPTTSSKDTLDATETDITMKTVRYSDAACGTAADRQALAGVFDRQFGDRPSQDVTTYSFTMMNLESKKLRTTTSVAPTATAPSKYTESIGKDPVIVQEMEIMQTGHTITCSTAECAAFYQSDYQNWMDYSVDPPVVVTACSTVTFAAGTATDVTACEQAEATANKLLDPVLFSPYTDAFPAELYFDGTNNRLYFSFIEVGIDQGYNNYVSGDNFYQK